MTAYTMASKRNRITLTCNKQGVVKMRSDKPIKSFTIHDGGIVLFDLLRNGLDIKSNHHSKMGVRRRMLQLRGLSGKTAVGIVVVGLTGKKMIDFIKRSGE